MSTLDAAMEAFPYAFHPIAVLGVGLLVVVYLEWDRQEEPGAPLWRRVAGFLGAGVSGSYRPGRTSSTRGRTPSG